jgi:hypothetical protein
LEVAPSLVSWMPPFDFIFFSVVCGRGEGIGWGKNNRGIQVCESQDLAYVCKERIHNKYPQLE